MNVYIWESKMEGIEGTDLLALTQKEHIESMEGLSLDDAEEWHTRGEDDWMSFRYRGAVKVEDIQ